MAWVAGPGLTQWHEGFAQLLPELQGEARRAADRDAVRLGGDERRAFEPTPASPTRNLLTRKKLRKNGAATGNVLNTALEPHARGKRPGHVLTFFRTRFQKK